MNVVVGNSIKIETDLRIGTERFRRQYFNRNQWCQFLFKSNLNPDQNDGVKLGTFEYMGKNRMILEDDDMLVDTITTHSSDSHTQVQIVVDMYSDQFDYNTIVNNILENAESIKHQV